MSDIDDIFDDKKLKQSIRKAKVKSILKIIGVVLIIFIIVSLLNILICLNLSKKQYEKNDAYVKLSIPNGYISESNTIIGFLGGTGTYKIAKNMNGKPVILEDKNSSFGILPPINYSVLNGGGYHIASQWPVSFWENGYKKMLFFHPELQYKEYKNDLADIEKIPDGKLIEMAISFDKPYKVTDLSIIQNKLKPVNVTWMWLNEFTDKKMQEYQYEIDNYDAKANGVSESDTIGLSLPMAHNGFTYNPYTQGYDEIVDTLNKSSLPEHKALYDKIISNGKTKIEDAEILGVIVHGTKSELKQLIDNPLIKASSIGVIVDPLYIGEKR